MDDYVFEQAPFSFFDMVRDRLALPITVLGWWYPDIGQRLPRGRHFSEYALRQ
jgi:hypothetical protein